MRGRGKAKLTLALLKTGRVGTFFVPTLQMLQMNCQEREEKNETAMLFN